MSDTSSSLLASERPPTTDGPSSYPTVTVGLVAHNPGAWFDEVLRSLVSQDWPAFEVVVIDAASDLPVAPRVHAIFPEATVIPLLANQGYAKNANVLLDHPSLGSFLLVCHDDVALAPDCIRRLVEEATRSNAGIVGPKLLAWTDPNRILHVGMTADKTGRVADIAEPGEYDQEQHDAVRDVFAVPGAVTLIRTDLFRALDGFDPAMVVQGEDLDLCWRAHVVGARVLINPAATARHREDLGTRIVGYERDRYARRHRIRSMLSNYSFGHLLRVAPQAFVVSVVYAVLALLQGRLTEVVDTFAAWLWNLRRLPSVFKRRRHLKRVRQVSDYEVRALQTRGFEGLAAWRRSQADRRSERLEGGADIEPEARHRRRTLNQISSLVAVGVAGVMLIGSRGLITGGIPMINQFVEFPDGPAPLLAEWGTTWHSPGLGSEAPSSLLHLVLGFLGIALFGQMGLLRLLVTAGLVVVGAAGAWRLLSPFGSIQGQLVALVVYVAVPLPWNSLYAGSWAGLAAYAAMPWMARRLAIAAGMAPYSSNDQSLMRRVSDVVMVGLIIVLAGLITPMIALAVAVTAIGWVVASLATSRTSHILRLLAVTVASLAVAFVLSLPSGLSLFSGDWSAWRSAATASSDGFELDQLARLATGPHGNGWFGWALLAVPVFALALAYGRRFSWAAGGWFAAIIALTLAWVGQQLGGSNPLADPQVVLAPAALGLAFAAGMTGVAISRDLPRYRFGWRQFVPFMALASLVVSSVAGFGGAIDGRWNVADDGWRSVFDFLDEQAPAHARMLWLGDASVLPVEGWNYDDDLAWSLTHARTPTVLDLPIGPPDEAALEVRDVLVDTFEGNSSRLGADLGVFGVRYLALVESNAPAPFGTHQRPIDDAIKERIAEQLDLIRVEVRDGVALYQNRAYVPLVASVPPDLVPADRDQLDVLPASPFELALPEVTSLRRYRGELGDALWLAAGAGDNWSLEVGGSQVERTAVTEWGSIFDAAAPGPARLEHRNDLGHSLTAFIQLAAWVALLVALTLGRRRRA